MTAWPNEVPTRFHDAVLRICPIYQIKIGNHIKYAFSREEMLQYDPSLWHKRFAYVLRAPQNRTPSWLNDDYLMDRPEMVTPIYRNSTWDILSNKPLDGNPTPVACVLNTPSQLLKEAGVVPIYVPSPLSAGENKGFEPSGSGSSTFLGYGWLVDSTTRHGKVSKVVAGANVTHTMEFGLAAGGGIYSWVVNDTTLPANRNIVNTANNGFGREIQVALFTQDWENPPGPNDGGQHNPTQNGTTYGDPTSATNGLGESHPLHPFTLESLLGSGSPVISFTETAEAEGGTSFDVWCCPLDFVQDRYANQVARDTNFSRPSPPLPTGETFPVNPLIYPTCLFRTKTWVKYKGDERVIQYTSWLKTHVDFNNYLNATYPFFHGCHASFINDQVGWMNKGYLYDPAMDATVDLTAIPDLWSVGNIRVWEIGRDGIYRLTPGPTTLISPNPFRTHWASFIAESTADNLCLGFVWALADNQDATRTQWGIFTADMRGVATPPPTASPALYFASNTHRLMRTGGPSPKPRPFLAGEYGPYYQYFVVGDLATVKAKIRSLYLQQVPL